MSRQNVYDDDAFFAGYQQLRDAESGINAAIEQPGLRALLPELAGRTVLDLGCGDGTLARELARRGAARVLGADPSGRMLALARARTADPRVRYVQGFAEDLSLRSGCADLVVSSLALHYVADLGLLLDQIARWLRPGGWLVASMEHPLRTAELAHRDDPGAAGRYAAEGRRDQAWYVERGGQVPPARLDHRQPGPRGRPATARGHRTRAHAGGAGRPPGAGPAPSPARDPHPGRGQAAASVAATQPPAR